VSNQPRTQLVPGAGSMVVALERNRAFAAAGGHQGAVVFPNRRLFVITCLDPRVGPAHVLGLGLGDAIVMRNVGGRVTTEVINDAAFIGQIAESFLPAGPLFEVAVIHHTQCGAGALADDTFRHRYAHRIGAEESALRRHAVLDPAATVARDVERLHDAPAISPRVTVSGHVYDVLTGLVGNGHRRRPLTSSRRRHSRPRRAASSLLQFRSRGLVLVADEHARVEHCSSRRSPSGPRAGPRAARAARLRG
jgi:carbonic anhydrase